MIVRWNQPQSPAHCPPGVASLLAALAVSVLATPGFAQERVNWPNPDEGLIQLEARAKLQATEHEKSSVEAGFRFEDQRAASGIDYVHGITEDGAREFKMVHYDHGNGLALADVNGDGHTDLYFVSQVGSNRLYKGRGDGTFEDITKAAGVGLEERISVAPAFADFDNDGDADLFVTTVRMGNVLFENDGKGHFTDVTARAGLPTPKRGEGKHASGVTVFDFDLDGLLDLFITNVGVYTHDETGPGGYYIGREDAFQGHQHPERFEPSELFRNLGDGRFENVTEAVGLVDPSFSGDASFADVDGNGFPDLYVLNMQGDDHLWLNQDGKRFGEATERFFPKTPWGAMGMKFFDANGDGRLDLYLTDMHSDMSVAVPPSRAEYQKAIVTWSEEYLQGGDNNIFGNALYLGTASGPWQEVSETLGGENYWPWGPSVGDLNADGYQDIFIASSMSYPYRYGINSVLLNDSGERLVHSEFVLGVEPRAEEDPRREWFELECGPDVEYTRENHPRMCAKRTGKIKVWGVLGTRTAAIFDADEDGDLDIVTGEFGAEPQVLISNLAQKKKVPFLRVDLTGTRSNRDGLGALVTVKSGEQRMLQQVDGKSGYLTQSSVPLYFALPAGRADSVEVIWPSGTRQIVTEGLEPGSTVEIKEPQAGS